MKKNLHIEDPSAGRGYSLMLQGLALALMGFGMVMIYSAQGRVDKPPLAEGFFDTQAGKQITFTIASIIFMSIFSQIDYRRFAFGESNLRFAGFWLIIIAIVLLAAVYIPTIGMEINGKRRWLDFGPVTFQPSEFAKLALVVFLAGKLTDVNYPKQEFLRGLLPLCAVIGFLCFMIGWEDLGTGVVIAAVSFLLLLAGGARLWHLVVPALIGLMGFIGLIAVFSYRMKRITSFLDPWSDPKVSGYHIIQSLIAIGTGGWWGKGLGQGLQKYDFLPEDTTDFIFSIICEELGIVGALAIIAVFITLLITGWLIYRRSTDDFGKLLVFGLICTIGLQAMINIAVATASMPTKGIALPFVSAGGSGLLFAAVAIGLVCSVNRNSE